jgi:methionine synthase / methylenetetrahydrofolate reductase(NADPH)
LERMRRAEAGGAEEAHAEGLRIAQEVLEAVRGMVQGVQVSTHGGRVEVALEALGQPTG